MKEDRWQALLHMRCRSRRWPDRHISLAQRLALLVPDGHTRHAAGHRRSWVFYGHSLWLVLGASWVYPLFAICSDDCSIVRSMAQRQISYSVEISSTVFPRHCVPWSAGCNDEWRPGHRLFLTIRSSPVFSPLEAYSGLAYWRNSIPLCARIENPSERDRIRLVSGLSSCGSGQLLPELHKTSVKGFSLE